MGDAAREIMRPDLMASFYQLAIRFRMNKQKECLLTPLFLEGYQGEAFSIWGNRHSADLADVLASEIHP